MDGTTEAIPLSLSEGKVRVHVEGHVRGRVISSSYIGGDMQVSGETQAPTDVEVSDDGDDPDRKTVTGPFSFRPISDAINAIAKELQTALEKAGPTKSSVKFGLEVGAESGALTALIVKGTGKAKLEVTLEWDYSKKP